MRIDLHRHLEGSHTPRALASVCARFGLTPPDPDALAMSPQAKGDAQAFYACITQARAAYAHLEVLEALAAEAFRDTAREADRFELRVSLFSMARTLLQNAGVDWRAVAPRDFAEAHARPVLQAVLRARDAAARDTGARGLVRLGFSRTYESEAHYDALAGVVEEHARELSGLDVLGIVTGQDREPLPPPLMSLVRRLRRALPDLTVHAGEFSGAASVERALDLEPQGIGHGIHAVESPATLARLAASGATLEVCPTSNALLVPRELEALGRLHGGAHPLVVLQGAGVRCLVATDDPIPFATTLPVEWERAQALGADAALLARDAERRWGQLARA